MRNRLNEGIGRIHNIMYKDIISEQNIPKVDFSTLANVIIDKLEGGYYHPNMLRDGRIRDRRYGASGETLYGMDRKHGTAFTNTPEGIKFWETIDRLDAKNKWEWNSMGGQYEGQLKKLAVNMIKPKYNEFLSRYVKDKNIIDLINSNAGLCINFIYAVWNGDKYFKDMANIIVRDYNNNIKDTNVLVSNLLKYRKSHTSSLIRQGGDKLEKIIKDNDYANVQSAGLDVYDVESEVSNSGSEFLNKLYSTALQSISSPAGNKQ
jgi:hypothetical protein